MPPSLWEDPPWHPQCRCTPILLLGHGRVIPSVPILDLLDMPEPERTVLIKVIEVMQRRQAP